MVAGQELAQVDLKEESPHLDLGTVRICTDKMQSHKDLGHGKLKITETPHNGRKIVTITVRGATSTETAALAGSLRSWISRREHWAMVGHNTPEGKCDQAVLITSNPPVTVRVRRSRRTPSN